MNGQAVVTGAPNSLNSNGLTASEQTYEDTINGFNTQIQGIMNGTTPLTASEEAQVHGASDPIPTTDRQAESGKREQRGDANIRGYQTGAAEYDPTFQQKTIGDIVSSGQTQIANLQTQEASAVASLPRPCNRMM